MGFGVVKRIADVAHRYVFLLLCLRIFTTDNNRMYGTIPAELGYLLHLTTLDVGKHN